MRIDRLGTSGGNATFDANDRLKLQSFRDRKRFAVPIDDDLCDPVMIPEVYKQQVSMIPFAIDPACEANNVANIFGSQLGAIVSSIRVHQVTFAANRAA
jgi:hypothetical protein